MASSLAPLCHCLIVVCALSFANVQLLPRACFAPSLLFAPFVLSKTNKVASGGGTNFPKANGSPAGLDSLYNEVGAQVSESGGVTVLPSVGKAILFYNLLPNGCVSLGLPCLWLERLPLSCQWLPVESLVSPDSFSVSFAIHFLALTEPETR